MFCRRTYASVTSTNKTQISMPEHTLVSQSIGWCALCIWGVWGFFFFFPFCMHVCMTDPLYACTIPKILTLSVSQACDNSQRKIKKKKERNRLKSFLHINTHIQYASQSVKSNNKAHGFYRTIYNSRALPEMNHILQALVWSDAQNKIGSRTLLMSTQKKNRASITKSGVSSRASLPFPYSAAQGSGSGSQAHAPLPDPPVFSLLINSDEMNDLGRLEHLLMLVNV